VTVEGEANATILAAEQGRAVHVWGLNEALRILIAGPAPGGEVATELYWPAAATRARALKTRVWTGKSSNLRAKFAGSLTNR